MKINFMKSVYSFLALILMAGVFLPYNISATQVQEPDQCGEEYTYTFSSGGQNNGDDSSKPANIDFINTNSSGNPDTVTVNADSGFSITKVQLSVDDDNQPGFYTYSNGPIDNLNPNPGTTINVAKVTVKKSCPDLCPNIDGSQYTVPEGMVLQDGQCVLPDICPNVLGVQTSGPCADQVCSDAGDIWNIESQTCDPEPVDACPQDEGFQESGPCQSDDVCPFDQGVQEGGTACIDFCPEEGIQEERHCESDDVCPNILGLQLEVPQGYHIDESNNCVPEENQCEDTSGSIWSDSNTIVKKIEVGGETTFPNSQALEVSVVAQIQGLFDTAWDASVDDSSAKWIWSEDPYDSDHLVDKWVTFKKDFNVDGNASVATLKIAADNSYEVWVNNTLVHSDSDPGNHSVSDTVSIPTNLLIDGSNSLEVRVLNIGLPDYPKENNPGGLLFSLSWQSLDCDDDEGGGGDNEKYNIYVKKYIDAKEVLENILETFSLSYMFSNGSGDVELNSENDYTWQSIEIEEGDTADIKEVTEEGNTLPVGAECVPGKYRLVKYTYGNNFYEAENSEVFTEDSFHIHSIDSDKYVIVWNELCPQDENPPVTECNDDIDNDNNGDIDELDPNCKDENEEYDPSINDEGEEDVDPTICSDGIDNDEDGLIDYPLDTGCESSQDTDESNGSNESNPPVVENPTNSGSGGGGGGGFSGGRRRDIGGVLGSSGEVLGASTEDEGLLCEPYLKSYIKSGANNDPEEVKKLQIFLNQFFELNNPVTGFYGPITLEMVNKFQMHQKDAVLTPWTVAGLPTEEATGYVYKTTKRWINILKCPLMIANSPVPPLP